MEVAEAAAEVQVEAGRKSPVVDAIAAAELKTSGEIRVHISQRFFDFNPLKSARYVFFQLGMFETEAHNGILIYLNIRKKKAAIFGDEAIYKKIEQAQWDELLAQLIQNLRTTHYENALAKCVLEMGDILAKYFPAHHSKNRDELSNDVSRD